MADNRIATRYAKSLMDLGIEQNSLAELNKDVLSISEALSNRDFKLFIKSPIIKADKKQSVFKAIFGDSLSKTTTSFFNIITRKGREMHLPEIVESFTNQYKAYNNITEIKLTTARTLSASSLEAIRKALLDSEMTDKEVEIETKVNEKLIGGFVIEFGDKLYDASVAHKLEKVRNSF